MAGVSATWQPEGLRVGMSWGAGGRRGGTRTEAVPPKLSVRVRPGAALDFLGALSLSHGWA